ncbi:ATPase, AAA-type, core [Metarhizium rileyi]|uniref:ATPase, AAA-type, core n=1 Tax=Metarhizium rileyi (strain RCEF 4871) TaxID=1649241 RepID=A0A162JLX3_METRR|nr:ATPase, AAA-type, core [Metarhizium rileyi RCEF 4871]
MESSQTDITAGNRLTDPSIDKPSITNKAGEAVVEENSKATKKNSETQKRSAARSTKTAQSGKSTKACSSGKNVQSRRHGTPRKYGRSSRKTEEISSESDDDSTDESEDDYSSSADESSGSSESDEEPDQRRHKHRRSRKSRSVSSRSRPSGRRDNKKLVQSNNVEFDPENDVVPLRDAGITSSKKWVNYDDPSSQRDIAEVLANLESRCAQLQSQMNRLSGNTIPAPAKPLGTQPASYYPPPTQPFGLAYPQYPSVSFKSSFDQNQTSIPLSTGRRGIHQQGSPHGWSPGLPVHSRTAMPRKTAHSKTTSRRRKRIDYKRVDSIWDRSLYAFKLQDTAKMTTNSKYDEYIFHVRRTFDSEGKYRSTVVDIKSKLLRECLQDVIGNVRGVSLVDETPKLDPNLLFLYLEDFRSHLKTLKDVEPAGGERRERKKNQQRLDSKRKQLKVLIKYLDKDYAKVKESLYPMLDSGIITFDYLWALWKPNTLVYSSTYGFTDDPRVFKVDLAVRHSLLLRGNFYLIDGKYLEFDGKKFGHGTLSEEIPEFQGTRKITSLPFYPLSYHKDEDEVRRMLIVRGKTFVALHGQHYKAYSGIAYHKRKKGSVIKFHIQQSRIMIDPATFRRINPNYYLSSVRPRDSDALSDIGFSDGEDDPDEGFSSDEVQADDGSKVLSKTTRKSGCSVLVTKSLQPDLEKRSKASQPQSLSITTSKTVKQTSNTDSSGEEKTLDTPEEETSEACLDFIDEDYLLASPVVLGFSFSEKQWLEFAVSRVHDIKWNGDAWDSLVLPPETKDLIQALVKSRKQNATQTIDDVIQGKGKGLVTVLHGPPGTGKTLTAEGISELLQCPLYMASAGELGTDSRFLEAELQKILDICHAWGAILLLDEADVFLEKRNMQDIHRNALVSIFLRQLEYFQGILFLTTNRVETFDEAFQSRIHIALRYEGLDNKAKKTIFKMFFDRVKAFGKLAVEPFSDEDLNRLAKHELNGREIKNMVGSAQDLAMNRNESLSMRHIQHVLDIHVKFGRDLRGGTGYEEAMRSYC